MPYSQKPTIPEKRKMFSDFFASVEVKTDSPEVQEYFDKMVDKFRSGDMSDEEVETAYNDIGSTSRKLLWAMAHEALFGEENEKSDI